MSKARVLAFLLIFLTIILFLALFFLFLIESFKILTQCYHNVTACPIDLRKIVGISLFLSKAGVMPEETVAERTLIPTLVRDVRDILEAQTAS